MSESAPLTSVPDLKASTAADISTNTLLTGIYTFIFFGTAYIYLRCSTKKSTMILCIVTLLYILNLIQMVMGWAMGYVYLVPLPTTGAVQELLTLIINDVIMMLTTTLADFLLLWRCYHVWGRSIRVVLLPFLMCVGYAAVYILSILESTNGTHSLRDKQSWLGAAIYTMSFTTILTTTLIIYRIVSISKGGTRLSGRKQFWRVIELLIQSSALYALSGFAFGSTLTNTREQTIKPCAVLNAVFFFCAGAAPTVMVARIALASQINGEYSISVDIGP